MRRKVKRWDVFRKIARLCMGLHQSKNHSSLKYLYFFQNTPLKIKDEHQNNFYGGRSLCGNPFHLFIHSFTPFIHSVINSSIQSVSQSFVVCLCHRPIVSSKASSPQIQVSISSLFHNVIQQCLRLSSPSFHPFPSITCLESSSYARSGKSSQPSFTVLYFLLD